MKNMKLVYFLVFLAPLLIGACDNSGVKKCEEIKSLIMQSGIENDLVSIIDFAESDKAVKKSIKYPFGAGISSLQNAVIPKGIGLKDDSEVQIVNDSRGMLVGVQIIDSQANSIVVLKKSNRWYAWSEDSMLKINEKIGVPCRIKD